MEICTRAGRVLRASGTRLAPTESGDEMPSRPILYKVSNLPLWVVHSLRIFYLGGISMDKVNGKLAVFFEDPFWVGRSRH